MDFVRIRELLGPHVIALGDTYTHISMPAICERLGLPSLRSEGTKREKITASFSELPNEELPFVAKQLLELNRLGPSLRNQIQDLIWADLASPEIPKRLRREVARGLTCDDLYMDGTRFDSLLERLWVLDDDDTFNWSFGAVGHSLRAEIHQHVHRNRGDWSPEELFDKLGAFEASNKRFAMFLEGLASSDVRPDEGAQLRFVGLVNEVLRRCGIELRESDTDGGYPVFAVVWTHTSTLGRPKNLIFASSVKPDLRFRDAVNNDIEIVTNADKVLVYDRPIPSDGLRWRDLQAWWSETHKFVDDEHAKKTLYGRLRDSLPESSPPQLLLFDAFYKGFGAAVPNLPALLPEVWLHWDPKTVKERGPDALARFRMDFLLLLPQGVRVVVEVDGKQHYAQSDGTADTAKYAKMVEADRMLKLAGYQVFRFGAQELVGIEGHRVVKDFFDALFNRFGVNVSGPSG